MNPRIVSLVGVVAMLSLMMLCVDGHYNKLCKDKTGGHSCSQDSDCCDHHKNEYICVKSMFSGNSWLSQILELMKRWNISGFSKQNTCLKCDYAKLICRAQSWYHNHQKQFCDRLKCKCGTNCPGPTPSTPTVPTTTPSMTPETTTTTATT